MRYNHPKIQDKTLLQSSSGKSSDLNKLDSLYSHRFLVFLLRSRLHTSDTNTIPVMHHHPSLNQPRLHPHSPATPPPTGSVGTTTTTTTGRRPVSESTRAPTAPTLWPARSWTSSGQSGTTRTGASGGATGPTPSSLYPTSAQPAPAPPAPLLGHLPAPTTGATPSTEATPSCRPSGSTWTLWSGPRRRTLTRGTK